MRLKDKVAELQAEQKRAGLRALVLEWALTCEPDAEHRVRTKGDGTYTWRLYRASGASGGAVVCTWKSDLVRGQRPSVVFAGLLDELLREVREGRWRECGPAREAAGRFESVRQTAIEVAMAMGR